MERHDFKTHLVIVEEVLSREIGVRNAIKVTHHELKTQLGESRVELDVANKIQVKIEEALVAANEEVKFMIAFLIEELAN